MMLNQNLLKNVLPINKASDVVSFEEDNTLKDLDKKCFELLLPTYTDENQTKREENTDSAVSQPKPRRRAQGQAFTNENYRSTKNIAKNYGKAIASFAVSDLAEPYLEKILNDEPCTAEEFMDYIRRNKELIQGIDSFRAMLLPKEQDDGKESAFKRIFRKISEIFIKCFSVNWICHGKMKDKLTYLKFRFKILRRIRNPELFTYLKKSRKRKVK